jgi:hypothetical protein
MSPGLLKCKDNNAALVKRIMPEASGDPIRLEAILQLIIPYNTGIGSQKRS